MLSVRNGTISTEQFLGELSALSAQGIDIGKLVAGLATLVTGGDVSVGIDAGGNAAENNVFCGGICIGILLAAISYATYQGGGNPLDGLEKIGAGTDPLGQAFASGVNTAVSLSAENFPDATKAAFTALEALGKLAGAVVTCTDEATGQIVSRNWNSLDQSTRNRLKGGAKILALVVPGGSVKALRQARAARFRQGNHLNVTPVNVRKYSDGSFRTPDGKFQSQGGLPSPGTKSAQAYTQFLRDKGFTVVGEELTVKGAVGKRRYDANLQDNKGELWGIEYKSGTGRKSRQQDFNDIYINRYGTTGVSKGIAGQEVVGNITIYLP